MKLLVYDLLHDFIEKYNSISLRILGGTKGFEKFVESDEILSPSYLFLNFPEGIISNSIALFTQPEILFMERCIRNDGATFYTQLDVMLKDHAPSLFIFPKDVLPHLEFLSLCNKFNIPVVQLGEHDRNLKKLISLFLEDRFSPRLIVHGNFVEIYGIGVLITGESGIGKSETALELIKRGHRLIADDMVIIKKMSGNFLFGHGSEIASHYMEIRGIGIIDIARLYGISAIRDKKRIDLKVVMEEWKQSKTYDRIGIIDKYEQILGMDIPNIVVPVKPGRNIPGIIETSALNFRLKRSGINSAKLLNDRLIEWMKNEKKINIMREHQ